MEGRRQHVAEGEQGACMFKEVCIHCPCISFPPGGQEPSCDVCEKQLLDNKCHESYIRRPQGNTFQGLDKVEGESVTHLSVAQEECANCANYNLKYEDCKRHVATVRVEAEMIEAELEGIEYIKGRVGNDESCISAIDELSSSAILRRIRLIQNFTEYLITSKPITVLRKGVCRAHMEVLPPIGFLEDIISNLLMVIWRGDINYVPHLQRQKD